MRLRVGARGSRLISMSTATTSSTDPILEALLVQVERQRDEAAARQARYAELAAKAEAAEAAYEAKKARQARLATKVPAALINEVKAYALDHYNDGGWDVIVECWEDADIAKAIAGATTLLGARRKLASSVSIWADREADARNSAF
jgi:hypothetical protein